MVHQEYDLECIMYTLFLDVFPFFFMIFLLAFHRSKTVSIYSRPLISAEVKVRSHKFFLLQLYIGDSLLVPENGLMGKLRPR